MCFLLGPVQFVVRWVNNLAAAQLVTLPPLLQTPAETLPRLAFRLIPFLWPISDHFMGSYLSMYHSQQCITWAFTTGPFVRRRWEQQNASSCNIL